MLFQEQLIVIRGAGSMGTAIAIRLRQAGFPVVMLEQPAPPATPQGVAFADAVYGGSVELANLVACLVDNPKEARLMAHAGDISLLIDPDATTCTNLRPAVLVDTRPAHATPNPAALDLARLVLGVGEHWVLDEDVHAYLQTTESCWGCVIPGTSHILPTSGVLELQTPLPDFLPASDAPILSPRLLALGGRVVEVVLMWKGR